MNLNNYASQPAGQRLHSNDGSLSGQRIPNESPDQLAARYASNVPQKPPAGHKAKGSVVPPLNLNQPGAAKETQER